MHLTTIVARILALVLAFTVHEYAHARSANIAGDATAKEQGRLTLNPLAHLDPVGTLFFIAMIVHGSGIGWGKPVPVNPQRFKDPRWDNLRVSLWGPLSNMILAVLFSMILYAIVIFSALGATRHLLNPIVVNWLTIFCVASLQTNICLAIFNILPIPPLDGSHILASILPLESARKYQWAAGKYGFVVLIALVYTGFLDTIITGPIVMLMRLMIPS